jgi:hypothetical protein
MDELPLIPRRYPYYPWEYAIQRLHADRAWDAAVDGASMSDIVLGSALALLILVGIVTWIKSTRPTKNNEPGPEARRIIEQIDEDEGKD